MHFLPALLACTSPPGSPSSADTDTDTDTDADTDTDTDTDTVVDSGLDPDPFAGDAACVPTDAIPGPHEPSQERGRPVDPVGGSAFDPRLAGCTWEQHTLGEDRRIVVYDELGRLVHLRVEGDSGEVMTRRVTLDDDGCVVDEGSADEGGGSATRSVCDHHGYPICAARGAGPVVHTTNTYVGDELVSAVSDDGRSAAYTWVDGRVVAMDVGGASPYSLAHTYDAAGALVRSENDDLSWWTEWTYVDGAATTESTSWLQLELRYDGGAWPTEAVIVPDDVVYATFAVTCP